MKKQMEALKDRELKNTQEKDKLYKLANFHRNRIYPLKWCISKDKWHSSYFAADTSTKFRSQMAGFSINQLLITDKLNIHQFSPMLHCPCYNSPYHITPVYITAGYGPHFQPNNEPWAKHQVFQTLLIVFLVLPHEKISNAIVPNKA